LIGHGYAVCRAGRGFRYARLVPKSRFFPNFEQPSEKHRFFN
jgi:hypothetical protein